MANSSEVQHELDLAANRLRRFANEQLKVISLPGENKEDAPFLAGVVSKLSPIIGNYVEYKIAKILNESASSGFAWKRQDPGFPDAVLQDALTGETLAGYEIKAWYALSTEITGRFRESINLLRDKNINVVVVAWCMSNIIFGDPTILDVLIVPAEEVARSRDLHYHKPPHYLIVEPNDTTARTANLQQLNANGYKLQADRIDNLILDGLLEREFIKGPPHLAAVQLEVESLMREFPYRLDTNFAKIDRIDNPDIESFKKEVLASSFLGKTISQWKKIFSDLNNADDNKRLAAEEEISTLYYNAATDLLEDPAQIFNAGNFSDNNLINKSTNSSQWGMDWALVENRDNTNKRLGR